MYLKKYEIKFLNLKKLKKYVCVYMIHNTSLMIFHLRIENKNKILEGIFKKISYHKKL